MKTTAIKPQIQSSSWMPTETNRPYFFRRNFFIQTDLETRKREIKSSLETKDTENGFAKALKLSDTCSFEQREELLNFIKSIQGGVNSKTITLSMFNNLNNEHISALEQSLDNIKNTLKFENNEEKIKFLRDLVIAATHRNSIWSKLEMRHAKTDTISKIIQNISSQNIFIKNQQYVWHGKYTGTATTQNGKSVSFVQGTLVRNYAPRHYNNKIYVTPTYEGKWKNDKFVEGTITENGDIYQGTWQNEVFVNGTITYKNGLIYEVDPENPPKNILKPNTGGYDNSVFYYQQTGDNTKIFCDKDDEVKTLRKMSDASGAVYEGEFVSTQSTSNSKPQYHLVKGIKVLADGHAYTGEWEYTTSFNNIQLKQFKGTLKKKDGLKYVGTWKYSNTERYNGTVETKISEFRGRIIGNNKKTLYEGKFVYEDNTIIFTGTIWHYDGRIEKGENKRMEKRFRID